MKTKSSRNPARTKGERSAFVYIYAPGGEGRAIIARSRKEANAAAAAAGWTTGRVIEQPAMSVRLDPQQPPAILREGHGMKYLRPRRKLLASLRPQRAAVAGQ